MKILAVLLLLLFGAVFLWQGPVVVDFFRQRVEVTTPEERAAAKLAAQGRERAAKREAEAREVTNEIVRLAQELEGEEAPKAPEMRAQNAASGTTAAQAENGKGRNAPAAKRRRMPGKDVSPQPM